MARFQFLVFVDASWRRAGLGTLLLRRLAAVRPYHATRTTCPGEPTMAVATMPAGWPGRGTAT